MAAARTRWPYLPGERLQDYVREAITRVLDGKRAWPLKVEIVTFLINVARSLISAEAEKNGLPPFKEEEQVPRHQTPEFNGAATLRYSEGGCVRRLPPPRHRVRNFYWSEDHPDRRGLEPGRQSLEQRIAGSSLTENEKTALYLREIFGLTGPEIQKATGWSKTKYWNISRAIRAKISPAEILGEDEQMPARAVYDSAEPPDPDRGTFRMFRSLQGGSTPTGSEVEQGLIFEREEALGIREELVQERKASPARPAEEETSRPPGDQILTWERKILPWEKKVGGLVTGSGLLVRIDK